MYFCFIDYAKAFDCVDHKKNVENSSRDGNTRPPYLPLWETFMQFKKQQLEPVMEHGTGPQMGKEYIKDVYCYLACLTYMQSSFMQNGGLDKAQARIKISRRNINDLRYADNTTLMAENEELKSLLMKVKEESEKVDL